MLPSESLTSGINAYLAEIQRDLTLFREQYAISFIVSISGGSDADTPHLATNAINELIDRLQNTGAAILTGGTQGGIPEQSTIIAKKRGIPTIAVFPPKGRKHLLDEYVDFKLETLPPLIGPAGFGTETPTFAQLPDYAVIIGGAFGTLAEAITILKINTKRTKEGQKPIYICPLNGSGQAADLISSLIQLDPQVAHCLPDSKLNTGSEIADFILRSEGHN